MKRFDARFSGLIAAAVLANGAAFADEPVAARNIRIGTILSASDVVAPQSEDGLRDAASFIGLEAARPIYKGEALSRDNLRAPTAVARAARPGRQRRARWLRQHVGPGSTLAATVIAATRCRRCRILALLCSVAANQLLHVVPTKLMGTRAYHHWSTSSSVVSPQHSYRN